MIWLALVAGVWLLGPIIVVGLIVAGLEWAARRRARLVVELDRIWALPAAERSPGRLGDLELGLLAAMDDDQTPHDRRHGR